MLSASRLQVGEASIIDGRYLRAARTKIDRFTGGPVDQALYDEEPVYGGRLEVALTLRRPADGEVGLIVLVLKDLLTGMLPVGGTSAVGRGIAGGRAHLQFASGDTIEFDPAEACTRADADVLNTAVQAFAGAEPREEPVP
jgi:hypothetical protein